MLLNFPQTSLHNPVSQKARLEIVFGANGLVPRKLSTAPPKRVAFVARDML
jgi:hypothetical protein